VTLEELKQLIAEYKAMEFRVRLLHAEKYKDITGTPVCQECDQYLPCDTIRALDGD
jgi:hypothetical protein